MLSRMSVLYTVCAEMTGADVKMRDVMQQPLKPTGRRRQVTLSALRATAEEAAAAAVAGVMSPRMASLCLSAF